MVNETRNQGATNTKERILSVACEKYLESGDKGLSMRNIAKEVGITPMAIYRHFENKEALQTQLLMEAFRIFSDYLYTGLKGSNATERFHMTVDGYFDFAAKQSAYFELIFLSTNPMNNLKMRDVIRKESSPTFRFLMDRVRECMHDGYFKNGSAHDISVSLLAQSTGLAALYLSNSFGWSEAEARAMQRKAMKQTLNGYLINDE